MDPLASFYERKLFSRILDARLVFDKWRGINEVSSLSLLGGGRSNWVSLVARDEVCQLYIAPGVCMWNFDAV